MSDLQELIRNARKELRKSSGLPLSAEEQNEDARKAALKDLRLFVVSRLGVQVPDSLCGKVDWTDNGPALIMQASGCVFHLRKAGDSELIYRLYLIGDGEREIEEIQADGPLFASRVLAAIGDVIPSGAGA
jgi:hypothetical protein